MWHEIISSLWFFLPGSLANVMPIIAAHLPFIKRFNQPLDGGRRFRGRPIFGTNKTYRGLIAGYLAALFIVLAQIKGYDISEWARSVSWLDYSTINPLLAALLFSVGALGGDALESFFKRQAAIPAGTSWFPFDQLDYIVGGLLATGFVYHLTLNQFIVTLVVLFMMHPLATTLGWLMGLKDKPI